MKMPEKHIRHAILAAAEQGIGQSLAFAMAYLRGRYNYKGFIKKKNRRNDVRHYRLCLIRDLSDSAGPSSNLAYITSVSLSATSVLTRLVRLINASLLKKPE